MKVILEDPTQKRIEGFSGIFLKRSNEGEGTEGYGFLFVGIRRLNTLVISLDLNVSKL